MVKTRCFQIQKADDAIERSEQLWPSKAERVRILAQTLLAGWRQPDLGVTLGGMTVVTKRLVLTVSISIAKSRRRLGSVQKIRREDRAPPKISAKKIKPSGGGGGRVKKVPCNAYVFSRQPLNKATETKKNKSRPKRIMKDFSLRSPIRFSELPLPLGECSDLSLLQLASVLITFLTLFGQFRQSPYNNNLTSGPTNATTS